MGYLSRLAGHMLAGMRELPADLELGPTCRKGANVRVIILRFQDIRPPQGSITPLPMAGHVSKDHVHLFVSIPPQLSISKVMGRIEGKTSRKLLSEYRRLAKEFWGRNLWARGYFAASSGNVTDEVIMQDIAAQDLEERARDGDFTLAP